ncbi:hypothetical protein BD780_002990 [Clostridium tetanomorphum]|nr:hypothetical protein [Clostridium tetanomorphum]NRS85765.1 hypothetical protein [Clostridium tetanomorphum]NRZ96226.1 hypothetical protein [Clostridium tetanomorphum]SQC02507.1 Uncharacterised protein [Clostridium tetanomorphum]
MTIILLYPHPENTIVRNICGDENGEDYEIIIEIRTILQSEYGFLPITMEFKRINNN